MACNNCGKKIGIKDSRSVPQNWYMDNKGICFCDICLTKEMDKGSIALKNFKKELTVLINKYCKESESNTPDFLLAEYLVACLEAFDNTVNRRTKWYNNEITSFTKDK